MCVISKDLPERDQKISLVLYGCILKVTAVDSYTQWLIPSIVASFFTQVLPQETLRKGKCQSKCFIYSSFQAISFTIKLARGKREHKTDTAIASIIGLHLESLNDTPCYPLKTLLSGAIQSVKKNRPKRRKYVFNSVYLPSADYGGPIVLYIL